MKFSWPKLRRSAGKAAPRAGRRRRRGLILGLPLVAALLLGALAGVGVASLIHMPRVESLADFTPSLITQIFDRNGRVFATFAREKRILLPEGEVPELLQQAVLAAEDANFFQHGGVDAKGVLRALLRNLGAGRKAMGGSTLTMQLARQLYLTPKKTWRRKIEETLLAVELEKRFSKQQILTLYCNLYFLGHGNYGMEAAARSYFDKSVDELALAEAAVLAGILQRPSGYSPYRRPDLVIARRDYVLRRMREEDFITEEAYTEALAEPLEVVSARRKDRLAPYFAEEVRRYLESEYGSEGLLQKGLQVETTLDPEMQRATETAIRWGLTRLDHRKGWRGPVSHVDATDLAEHQLPTWTGREPVPGKWFQGLVVESGHTSATIRHGDSVHELTGEGIAWTRRKEPATLLSAGDVAWFSLEPPGEDAAEEAPPILQLEQQPELQAAAVILESATGAVRAMVGGWDFEQSSFNRATQARRQIGSAFKPFVFGAALEGGFTPADTVFDAPTVFEGANQLPTYSPRNFYRRYYGITTLRKALEKSMNVSSAKLMDMVGTEQVIDFAQRSGITSDLPPYPSLALGAAELSPIELASGYSAIANQGISVAPYLIERVSGPDGRVLEEQQPRAHKAMEPEIAYVLGSMLEGVVDRGTAISVADLEVALAGKTGTTDGYIDAWFAGYTPRYTILVWVGYDVNRSIGRNMTGAVAALPIWRSIISQGLENDWIQSGREFVRPPGISEIMIEYTTGLLPGPGARQVIQEAFLAGTEPVRQYEPRWGRILALPWYQQRPFYLPKAGERMPEDTEDWSLVQEAWELKAEDEE